MKLTQKEKMKIEYDDFKSNDKGSDEERLMVPLKFKIKYKI